MTKSTPRSFPPKPHHPGPWALPVILGLLLQAGGAGAFDPGSTGSDGALDFSGLAPDTVVEFDPAAFDPPLDPDGDGVYHFTTITVPEGVTVRLRADRAGRKPIQWLATGTVSIAGTIDLSGEDGHGAHPSNDRVPAEPGPGGFQGGTGALAGALGNTDGWGPGGGKTVACASVGWSGCSGGAHATSDGAPEDCAEPVTYGNVFLLPLIGGSGGAGAGRPDAEFYDGGGGGAGGGALLIASAASITVDGAIIADGGEGASGGSSATNACGGAGGAIRLVAPVVAGSGRLSADGGDGWYDGGDGRIRVEATDKAFTGTFSNDSVHRTTTLIADTPLVTNLGAGPFPAIRITSVDGASVPLEPNGQLDPVDVTIDSEAVATVLLEGQNLPLGTVIELTVVNESEGAATVASTPLAGTEAVSTASATVRFPPGYSRIYTRATY